MTSVKVAVRVRPRSLREKDSPAVVEMEGNKARIFKLQDEWSKENKGCGVPVEQRVREFTFDHCFWSACPADPHFVSQKQVFKALGVEVVDWAYDGFNVCVLAYGQTGSGKTYTMMGERGNLGFVPRLCEGLFGRMTDPTCTYRTQISFMEIYNEQVRDLLMRTHERPKENLRIREHPILGPYVDGLTQHTVVSLERIVQLIRYGNMNRVTASTLLNDTSSRSHAVFTVTFTQAKLQNDTPSERQSKINLVDLAGSERVHVTGSTGVRLREGGNINKSLVTLGNVMSALAEVSKRSRMRRSSNYVPYRNSKLTYLLRDSLGGNAKTIMIATVSPTMMSYGESLSTLKFASRARHVVTKPTVNEDHNVQLIRELREEIARLQAQLSAGNADLTVIPSVHEELHAKEARMKVLTDQWTDKWKEVAAILQEEEELELRKAGRGVGVVLDSSLPHLVSVEDDVLSTGVVLYHIKEGHTKIGTEQSSDAQDIVICGGEAKGNHCVIECRAGEVTLHPTEGAVCFVNGARITRSRRLNQGALIQLGKNLFRFNYPAEASRLKEIRRSLSTLALTQSVPGDLTVSCHVVSRQSRSLADVSKLLKPSENVGCLAPCFSGSVCRCHSSEEKLTTDSTIKCVARANRGELAERQRPLLLEEERVSSGDEDEQDLSLLQHTSVWTHNTLEPVLRPLPLRYRGQEPSTEPLPTGPLITQEQVLTASSMQIDKERLKMKSNGSGHTSTCNSFTQTSEALCPSWWNKRPRVPSRSERPSNVEISIPRYALLGTAYNAHYEYDVKITTGLDTWSVSRCYSMFRELHQALKKLYPRVMSLDFPRFRLFHWREKIAVERQTKLEAYLRELVRVCREDMNCPLHPRHHLPMSRDTLPLLHPFFRKKLVDQFA